jgi:predicted phosphodiesterase
VCECRAWWLVAALTVSLGTQGCSAPERATEGPPPDFKIAFIGDQGTAKRGEKAPEVLELIKAEGADALVHQGDLDYEGDPAAWEASIDRILGSDFPYFASVGNHDEESWYGPGGYQERLEDRLERLGIEWDGELGVKSSLAYKGVFLVLVGPDVFGDGHAEYIRDRLAKDRSLWSICSWHKNQRPMQVGGKPSETGWGVYEEARRGGALIATGHEHSYSRTHLLSDMENQVVASRSDTLVIERGKTFAFVNGMGGRSMRPLRGLPLGDWWAKVYTTDNGSNFGALFGTFNVEGRPDLAEFYFKDIDGNVADRFLVISRVEGEP